MKVTHMCDLKLQGEVSCRDINEFGDLRTTEAAYLPTLFSSSTGGGSISTSSSEFASSLLSWVGTLPGFLCIFVNLI